MAIEDMNELATIIVPMYNGKKYIKKLLSNIFTQSYQNIELIILDDGSSDGSGEYVSELLKRAPSSFRVKMINQDNSGIPLTRNRGLDEASGEYIFFIDQDDGIRKEYISSFVEEMNKTHADMVIGGYELVDTNGYKLDKWVLNPDKLYSKYRITAPWARVYRKDIIDKYGIRFMNTKVSEDMYFNLVYMSYCSKISVTSYCGYRWTYNEQSESHSNWNKISDERDIFAVLTQIQEDMSIDNCLEDECVGYMNIKHIVWYLFYVAKNSCRKDLEDIYNSSFEWLDKYYPHYYNNRVIYRYLKYGESFKVGMIVMLSVILKRLNLLFVVLRLYSKL